MFDTRLKGDGLTRVSKLHAVSQITIKLGDKASTVSMLRFCSLGFALETTQGDNLEKQPIAQGTALAD
jgi:hypothetical protein